jgi:hypothetical protein
MRQLHIIRENFSDRRIIREKYSRKNHERITKESRKDHEKLTKSFFVRFFREIFEKRNSTVLVLGM